MSVTSGFFNSLNGDRRYDARQMSAIFDGIINDGVLANIGTAFAVKAAGGNDIHIGIGRAWFNSAWLYNDAVLTLTIEPSEVLLDRWDAVVIEIDHSAGVRSGDIKVVTGTASSDPQYPTLTKSTEVNQYPLAYILCPANSSSITQAEITNMIGTSECPFVTGILQVQSIDHIVAQWEAQWNQWFSKTTTAGDAEMDQWFTDTKAEFDAWFNSLQLILEGDVATALAMQVLELQNRFETLAAERAIYYSIESSTDEEILDSEGNTIESHTAFPLCTGHGGVGGSAGQAAEQRYYDATLIASGWSDEAPHTQTVAVTGLRATDRPIIDILISDDYATAKLEAFNYGYIYRIVAKDDAITAYSTAKLDTDLNLQLGVIRT